jgi:DNA helicase-2/ATP-dependent DNA helicase PcrA
MIAPEALTDEQLRIVRHHEGPAVVFAVAGVGKTTAVVHRVRRLVDERGVDPGDILASSFSQSTAMDLEGGTRELGVSDVDCRTLHSLGRQFVRMAEAGGHQPHRLDATETDPERLSALLAGRARSRLAQEQGLDERDLGIEQRDLVEQIGAWKAQLCYPDLEGAGLPDRARRHASQAEHDNEDLVTLYRYYEEERAREGWITFDDMLLEGWEALMWFDEVRGRAQTLYEHVLVDEFQDISPVQYLMLDVLTEPHHDDARRNYMAIGDRPVHLRVAGGRPVASLGLPGGVQWRRIRSIPGATNRACECRYCKRKTPTGEAY